MLKLCPALLCWYTVQGLNADRWWVLDPGLLACCACWPPKCGGCRPQRNTTHATLQDRSKPVGLKNLGNTCYVNSVLQVLLVLLWMGWAECAARCVQARPAGMPGARWLGGAGLAGATSHQRSCIHTCNEQPTAPPSRMQCLFANAAFRRAVYAAKEPLASEPIVKELR